MMLADRLRTVLEEGHKRDIGIGPLGVRDPRLSDDMKMAQAAVLIAVTDRPEPGLILTQRSSKLRSHAGQVAFPGGRVDPEDKDVVDAALREAWEEIALPRERVEIVGVTDRFHTFSGFDIFPVIGVVPPDLPLVAHEAEVEAVFEVPFSFALDPVNRKKTEYQMDGETYHYYELSYADRRIWGVTAHILFTLANRIGHDALAA